MKKQINLIPREMSVPGKTVTISKIINKISTIGTIVLIFIAIVLISVLVFFNLEYKKSTTNVENLKSRIVELERSEQKLILAKDKLAKISYIKKLNSVDTELTNFQDFKLSITASSAAKFTEISITPEKTETSLTFTDSANLGAALEVVSKLLEHDGKDYKNIILSSLGFSPNTGYLVSLIFKN